MNGNFETLWLFTRIFTGFSAVFLFVRVSAELEPWKAWLTNSKWIVAKKTKVWTAGIAGAVLLIVTFLDPLPQNAFLILIFIGAVFTVIGSIILLLPFDEMVTDIGLGIAAIGTAFILIGFLPPAMRFLAIGANPNMAGTAQMVTFPIPNTFTLPPIQVFRGLLSGVFFLTGYISFRIMRGSHWIATKILAGVSCLLDFGSGLYILLGGLNLVSPAKTAPQNAVFSGLKLMTSGPNFSQLSAPIISDLLHLVEFIAVAVLVVVIIQAFNWLSGKRNGPAVCYICLYKADTGLLNMDLVQKATGQCDECLGWCCPTHITIIDGKNVCDDCRK